MKLKILITIIFFFSSLNLISACDCDYQGNFLAVSKEAKIVALVKVKKFLTYKKIYNKKIPMSMLVEVKEILNGKETRKKIKIWGDNGNLCRPYLNEFEIGKHYILAIDNALNGENGYVHSKEKETDYYVSNCGCYWLNYDMKNKTAKGDISKNEEKITHENLVKYFNPQK